MGASVETKITNPIQHEILHPNSCIGLQFRPKKQTVTMRRNCIALENGMRTGLNKRLPITVSQIKLGIAGIVVQWIVVKTWFAQEKLTTWVARVLICVTLANFVLLNVTGKKKWYALENLMPNLENKCLV